MKYCFWRGGQFGTGYQVINNCFFISEGAFTFKVEGTGVIIIFVVIIFVDLIIFVSRDSEVIIIVSINENN